MKAIQEAGNRLLEIAIDLAAIGGRVGLFPHERFDADAIGAAVSFSRALRALGCETSVLVDEAVPDSLSHLPGLEEIIIYEDMEDCPALDLAIAIDCYDADRMGERGACYLNSPLRGAVDHHVYEGEPDMLDLIDVSASSSCELVFSLIWELELQLSRPLFDETMAVLLLAGTITDTGRYSYSNTTPLCLRQAASLLERFRVDLAALHHNLYERTTVNRLQIKGDIFSTISSVADGRILLAHVSRAMLKKREAPDDELSNLASEIRAADDAAAVFLLIESENGDIRVSIRSNSCFDSQAFARQFNGGGHVKAAGMTLQGLSIDEAKEKIAVEAEHWLNICSKESDHE